MFKRVSYDSLVHSSWNDESNFWKELTMSGTNENPEAETVDCASHYQSTFPQIITVKSRYRKDCFIKDFTSLWECVSCVNVHGMCTNKFVSMGFYAFYPQLKHLLQGSTIHVF